MKRNFHVVDYATDMSIDLPPLFNLNEEFTMSAPVAYSPYNDGIDYVMVFNLFDFNNQTDTEPFPQKFEELNPIINPTSMKFKIFPNVRFTIPVGFTLDIQSIIPGIAIKHIRTTHKAGITYSYDDEIEILDHRKQKRITRIVGNPDLYDMYEVTLIEFEIFDSEYIKCTSTGIEILRDKFPFTNLINVEFKCLSKEVELLYADLVDISPQHGCDDPLHYNRFHVIRNQTLYNYMYA